jgi:Fic family protein
MATPTEKIAASVEVLRQLQQEGRRIVRSEQLSRTHRERLLRHGVLQPVIKGWLMPAGLTAVPDVARLLWEFCGAYCADRFGSDWHLSPENSLLLVSAAAAVPERLVIHAPNGTNNRLELPFGATLYDLRCESMPAPGELLEEAGLRLLTTEAALVRVTESFFVRYPEVARAALARVGAAGDVVRLLLEGGHSAVAGRIAGALRRIDRGELADTILQALKAASYDVRATDPFGPAPTAVERPPQVAPIVARMQELWQAMRETVVHVFPAAPEARPDRDAYLRSMDDVFARDAFHSLALEGYRITPEVIQRAATAASDPVGGDERRGREVLDARAYWRSFQLVKQTVAKVLAGENAGALTRTAYVLWQRELSPTVSDTARSGTTSDAGSRHLSLRWKAEREAVPALFDLLEQEPAAAVRAVLGHWMFGYVHQYPASDGRLARFVLNVMLASAGYPWTVIRVEDRAAYTSALESASLDADVQPLARFIADRVRVSLEQPRTTRAAQRAEA